MKRIRHLYIALLFGFLLGVRDGYITLWKTGVAEPVQIFPYKAQYLPERDRQALEQGIQIEDELELAQLLEDYLS